MFESIINFFKKTGKPEKEIVKSKDAAKERLHLVLMQDRANVSADFLELMKQEIIEVIKKYIDVDENAIDVRLTNKTNGDGTNGAPALYANIPIVSIKEDVKRVAKPNKAIVEKTEENKEVIEKIETEKTESQNSSIHQASEEIKQNEQSNEPKPYENVNRENTNTLNEPKPYENVNRENASTPNESKPYENVNRENANTPNEPKPYENINRENKTQEETTKQQTQAPTESKWQLTSNYTKTF